MRAREIDFAVIGEAWGYVSKGIGHYAGFAAIGIIVTYIASSMFQIPMQAQMAALAASGTPDFGAMMGVYAANSFLLIMGQLVSYFITGAMLFGLCSMAMEQLKGGKADIAVAFASLKNGLSAGVVMIIAGFLSSIGVLACIVGAFVVSGLLMLSIPAMVTEKLSIADSLKRSYELTKGQILMATAFYFVVAILAVLGVIACGLGVFVTVPLSVVATYLVYRDLSGVDFLAPAEVGATNYPRSGEGSMPTFTEPVEEKSEDSE